MSLRSQLLARVLLDIPAIPRDAEDRRAADELLDDINAGRVKCSDLSHEGKIVGSLVYEVRGPVFIVHALRADNIPADCTALGEQVALDLARRHGCKLLHCDSKRPGLLVKLIELGWTVHLVALRKIV